MNDILTTDSTSMESHKTMQALYCYELFDNYLIDDFQNVYRKSSGLLLQKKKSYYLKCDNKFSKFRPEWLIAWVKMNNIP